MTKFEFVAYCHLFEILLPMAGSGRGVTLNRIGLGSSPHCGSHFSWNSIQHIQIDGADRRGILYCIFRACKMRTGMRCWWKTVWVQGAQIFPRISTKSVVCLSLALLCLQLPAQPNLIPKLWPTYFHAGVIALLFSMSACLLYVSPPYCILCALQQGHRGLQRSWDVVMVVCWGGSWSPQVTSVLGWTQTHLDENFRH